MIETIDVDDRGAAATTGTGPAAHRTRGIAAAAHTAPESTDRDLDDSPGAGLAPALGHRVPGRTLQLRPISRRSSRVTDTRVLTRGRPPGPAHDPAPGPAGNLEAASGNRSFLT